LLFSGTGFTISHELCLKRANIGLLVGPPIGLRFVNSSTEGLELMVGRACLLLLFLGLSFYVYVCHTRGALHAY